MLDLASELGRVSSTAVEVKVRGKRRVAWVGSRENVYFYKPVGVD